MAASGGVAKPSRGSLPASAQAVVQSRYKWHLPLLIDFTPHSKGDAFFFAGRHGEIPSAKFNTERSRTAYGTNACAVDLIGSVV